MPYDGNGDSATNTSLFCRFLLRVYIRLFWQIYMSLLFWAPYDSSGDSAANSDQFGGFFFVSFIWFAFVVVLQKYYADV